MKAEDVKEMLYEISTEISGLECPFKKEHADLFFLTVDRCRRVVDNHLSELKE